jgi:hypothetical protein
LRFAQGMMLALLADLFARSALRASLAPKKIEK